jgi:NADH-quinone oxidoreductase subunit J
MTVYAFLFYIVAAVIVAATAMAITRRNLVHVVVYLVLAHFSTALLFYLLGAPLLAALEVIIYAGAIMVLFLFVVMMIKMESHQESIFPLSQWLPAAGLGLVFLIVVFLMVSTTPGTETRLPMTMADPRKFARYVFERHWLSIEIVSLLLLIALIGALHLGRAGAKTRGEEEL